jgi:hypothetical protein
MPMPKAVSGARSAYFPDVAADTSFADGIVLFQGATFLRGSCRLLQSPKYDDRIPNTNVA